MMDLFCKVPIGIESKGKDVNDQEVESLYVASMDVMLSIACLLIPRIRRRPPRVARIYVHIVSQRHLAFSYFCYRLLTSQKC